MIKKYEACFLFKSEDIDYKSSLEEVKKCLLLFNATNFIENSFGERVLEYPIKKQNRGSYEIIEFDMESDNLRELDSKLKLINNLIRYMILVKVFRKINTKKIKKRNFREFRENIDRDDRENSTRNNVSSEEGLLLPSSSVVVSVSEKLDQNNQRNF